MHDHTPSIEQIDSWLNGASPECADCAAMVADLATIHRALAALPLVPAPRSFALDAATAARLRPARPMARLRQAWQELFVGGVFPARRIMAPLAAVFVLLLVVATAMPWRAAAPVGIDKGASSATFAYEAYTSPLPALAGPPSSLGEAPASLTTGMVALASPAGLPPLVVECLPALPANTCQAWADSLSNTMLNNSAPGVDLALPSAPSSAVRLRLQQTATGCQATWYSSDNLMLARAPVACRKSLPTP